MVQEAPLKGRVVAITRPTGQAEEAGDLIKTKGGVPYYIPALEIKGLCDVNAIKKFIWELLKGNVDYVILMSTNGVKYLFEAAKPGNRTLMLHEGLSQTTVIAVGPKTAEALQEHHIRVDIVPQKYSSEGLLEVLKEKDIKGKTIRIPRTSKATPILKNALTSMGANVEEIYVYESGLPEDEVLKSKFYEDLTGGCIDALLFGSGLSAKNIFKMLTEKAPIDELRKILKEKVTVVAIGPTTAEALKELGIDVDVVPNDYLFDSALDALADYWSA
jgi:uroporphyrinogen-III synthase